MKKYYDDDEGDLVPVNELKELQSLFDERLDRLPDAELIEELGVRALRLRLRAVEEREREYSERAARVDRQDVDWAERVWELQQKMWAELGATPEEREQALTLLRIAADQRSAAEHAASRAMETTATQCNRCKAIVESQGDALPDGWVRVGFPQKPVSLCPDCQADLIGVDRGPSAPSGRGADGT